MGNRSDFLISEDTLEEAVEAFKAIPPLYEEQVSRVEKASAELVSTENWKGPARDEFYETYLIVQHELECDSKQISSIVDIVSGFKELYTAADKDSAAKIANPKKED